MLNCCSFFNSLKFVFFLSPLFSVKWSALMFQDSTFYNYHHLLHWYYFLVFQLLKELILSPNIHLCWLHLVTFPRHQNKSGIEKWHFALSRMALLLNTNFIGHLNTANLFWIIKVRGPLWHIQGNKKISLETKRKKKQ